MRGFFKKKCNEIVVKFRYNIYDFNNESLSWVEKNMLS